MRALPQPPLLVISDRGQAALPLEELAGSLLEAGCRWFSLREKDLSRDSKAALLTGLRPAFEAAGALLSLHDRDGGLAGELALKALHLSGGGDPTLARRQMGEGALIGVSCHSRRDLERAAALGADYASISPVFPSKSKTGYPALSSEEAAALLANPPLPVIALGGIEGAGEAKACRAMGAAGLAMMGPVMRSKSPGAAFAALAAGWESAA